MRFAIILSAGGSAFFAAYDILVKTKRYSKDDFIVIVDRTCAAEKEAFNRGIYFERINYDTKDNFSKKVVSLLIKKNVLISLMLYSKLISGHLFSAIPTLNVHPALLPSFKGLNPVGQALDFGVKFMGASLHITTEKMDEGAIVGQVVSPINFGATKEQLDRVSFLQKAYLIIMMLDCTERNLVQFNNSNGVSWTGDIKFNYSSNPCIQSRDLSELFDAYQEFEGMKGTIQ